MNNYEMCDDYYKEESDFFFRTNKLSTSDLRYINHPFLNMVPKHLYKYRKCGNKEFIDFYVRKRKMYCASFTELGDEFEGITPATRNRILKMDGVAICKHYKSSFIEILKNKFPSINDELANKIFDIILEENFENPSIYKRVSPLFNDADWKQLRPTLGAYTYLFEKIDEELNSNTSFGKGMRMLLNINDEMGAYSLCDSYKNDNLWCNYASDYKGYCIEYDLTQPLKSRGSYKFITNLFPVIYVDKKDDDWFKKLYEATIQTINLKGKPDRIKSGIFFNQWMTKTLCTKKKIFSNEYEWRVLGKANTSYLGPLVSCVIVGHKICKEDFDLIQDACNENKFPIKITDIDYENQEVIIRDITPDDIKLINQRTT